MRHVHDIAISQKSAEVKASFEHRKERNKQVTRLHTVPNRLLRETTSAPGSPDAIRSATNYYFMCACVCARWPADVLQESVSRFFDERSKTRRSDAKLTKTIIGNAHPDLVKTKHYVTTNIMVFLQVESEAGKTLSAWLEASVRVLYRGCILCAEKLIRLSKRISPDARIIQF